MLNDWDISRDAPYFGFEIPGAPGKYFYVWLDAPIGYFAALKKHFDSARSGLSGRDAHVRGIRLGARGRAVPLHRQGHPLLPHAVLAGDAAVLRAQDAHQRVRARLPHRGTGEKMSKSRGTGLSPQRYLELGMNPEWLRYYFAAKLNDRVEDLDLNLDDFVARVNSDLVGKYVNIASRAAAFIAKTSTASCSRRLQSGDVASLARAVARVQLEIARHTKRANSGGRCARSWGSPTVSISASTQAQPWELAKDPARRDELQFVCSRRAQMLQDLTCCLAPVLPTLARASPRIPRHAATVAMGRRADAAAAASSRTST